MNVLALDSATSACSAAVLCDGRAATERFAPMMRGQVAALMPMVLAAMDEAGVGFDALDLVAVTVGPGSFTGLRAGLAAARGIALARALPLAGITTLEAVAAASLGEAGGGPVLVALETRRADLYVQLFAADGAGRPVAAGAAAARPPESLAAFAPAEPFLLAGDGARRAAAALAGRPYRLADGPGVPRAAVVAALAAEDRRTGRVRPARPFYLHPPAARLPVRAAGGAS